jgi:Family of unknown function (DUF5317)
MIIVVLSLIGVLTVPLFGGKLKRFATIRMRAVWLVWVSVLGQIVVFEGPLPMNEQLAEQLHLVTYALSGAFLFANRHITGAKLLALGGGLNLAAIAANGGVMPASAWAWRVSGMAKVAAGDFENSNVTADAKLWFFGDVFAIPEAWPLSNVFSIGDVLIVVAVVYCGHKVCRTDPFASPPKLPQPSWRDRLTSASA